MLVEVVVSCWERLRGRMDTVRPESFWCVEKRGRTTVEEASGSHWRRFGGVRSSWA